MICLQVCFFCCLYGITLLFYFLWKGTLYGKIYFKLFLKTCDYRIFFKWSFSNMHIQIFQVRIFCIKSKLLLLVHKVEDYHNIKFICKLSCLKGCIPVLTKKRFALTLTK